jgi:hypothetical protein
LDANSLLEQTGNYFGRSGNSVARTGNFHFRNCGTKRATGCDQYVKILHVTANVGNGGLPVLSCTFTFALLVAPATASVQASINPRRLLNAPPQETTDITTMTATTAHVIALFLIVHPETM